MDSGRCQWECGQSQFAPLKLRSLALVPSSGALPRPSELHSWQLHCKTLPAAPRRFGQRLAAVPRPGFAGPYAKGITRISRVPIPAVVQGSGQPSAGLSPPGRCAPSRPIKEKRSRDCDRTSRPQTLAGLSPTAPRGHNRPGAAVPVRASVPRIRVH